MKHFTKKLLFMFACLAMVSSASFAVSVQTSAIPGGWVWKLAQSTASTNIMYAASYTVHKSTDYGHTWVNKPFTTGLTKDSNGYDMVPVYNCSSLAIKSDDSNTVIAGDSGFRENYLFKTTNGGDTWTAITIPGLTGQLATKVVVASQSNSNTFFAAIRRAGTGGPGDVLEEKLYKTTDIGASWTDITPVSIDKNHAITDVMQLPNGRVIIAVADGNFSENVTTVPTTGTMYYTNITGINPAMPVPLTTWAPTKITWDWVNGYIWAIDTKGKIHHSGANDWGDTWTDYATKVKTFDPDCVPYQISYFNVAASTPSLFVVGFNDPVGPDVKRSTDTVFADGTFTSADMPSSSNGSRLLVKGKIYGLLVDQHDPTGNSWILSTTEGVFFSTDNGHSFNLSEGICNREVRFGIAEASGRIFANVFDNNLYRSLDFGATWTRVFPPKDRIISMMEYCAVQSASSTVVFVHGDSKIFKSVNNGDDGFNFSAPKVDFSIAHGISTTDSSQVTNILINPQNTDIMYAGVATNNNSAPTNSYLFKSVDEGTTWTQVTSLTSKGIHHIEFDPNNPDIIFCCVGSNYGHNPNSGVALYKSTDAATTWTKLCDFNDSVGFMQTLTIDPDNTDYMWCGFFGPASESYGSTDGGKTWSAVKINNNPVYAGKIYYYKPSLYTAIGNMVWKSDDKGTNWTLVMEVPAQVEWIFKNFATASNAPGMRSASATSAPIYAASDTGLYSIFGFGVSGNGNIVTTTYSGDVVKSYVFPNPFNPKNGSAFKIRLSLPNAANKVTVKIYSLSGEEVYETSADNLIAGTSSYFSWDGNNQSGSLCAPGLYFVVVDVDGNKQRSKLVIVY